MRDESSRLGDRRRSPLYPIWCQMRYRCQKPTHPAYGYYGGRGITVCAAWASFVAFWNWSLEHGYRQGLSLDRTDNDGPYSPDNCRWVDRLAQANNMRSNRRVAIFGDVRTVAEWARDLRCRVARRQLQKRIDSGWTPEIALLTPAAEDYLVTAFGETKTIYGWSRDRRCTVSNDALRNRLNKAGWPPELAISLPRQNWRTMVKIPSSDPPS